MAVDADTPRSLLLSEVVADDQLVAKDAGHRSANRASEGVSHRSSER